MEPAVPAGLLDGHQQMVGENAEEDMSLDAPLQMVEDRPLRERTFHGAEGGLDAREENVGPPDLLSGEVGATGLQQIAAHPGK